MVDIRLITLIPPAPAIGQPPSAPNVTAQPNANILAQFPPGSVLSGYIINRDATGNPILRTEKGDVLFSSNFFLKIGSEVVIRIQNTSGHQNAHIVTVNGLPPEIAETQSAFTDTPETITTQKPETSTTQQTPQNQTQPRTEAAAPATPALPRTGATLSAIVITPAPSSSVTPGTSLLLSVVNPTQANTPQAPSALAQLVPSAPQAPAPANALASLLPSAPTASFAPIAAQTFTNMPANVLSDSPLANAAPFTQSNQQAADAKLPGPLGQTFTATAVAQGGDDSMTFESPIGTLRIANLPHLPQGQQFTLRVASVANPSSYTIARAAEAAPAPLMPLTQLTKTWPSLQQIVQLLGEDGLTTMIPTFATGNPLAAHTANAQAGSQMLFFISALKGGSFRDWLGAPNVKALEEKGFAPLLRKADGEFQQIARQFTEPQPGNWQSAFIPVMANGELTQLRAFIKREKKKNEQGKPTGDEDTRFVLEMELSQLGAMQMDGLVKRREQNLQFDLIVRSLEPLPKELQGDIQTIYQSTAELTGYRGQLVFQPVHTFPVHPLEDTTPHVFDDIVV